MKHLSDFNNTNVDDNEYALRQLTHELGNILTLINSSLQIISSSHPEVHEFKYWDSTLEDVHYLKGLLADISTYNHGSTLNLSLLNFSTLLKNIISSVYTNEEVIQKNITINCKIHSPLPEYKGDYIKLKEVILNLIKNAVEASPENSSIDIIVTSNTHSFTLQVVDHGIGIPADKIKEIFLPLYTSKKTGSGLGLAVSKKIIEAHKGTITVKSKLGKETVFSICLPRNHSTC